MSEEKRVFQLLGETTASIYPLARDVMRPLFEEHFSEQRLYGSTFLAFQLQPQALTKELLLKRNPYINPRERTEVLSDAAKIGYLVQDGENFTISDQGKAIITDIHDKFYKTITQFDYFPADKRKSLAGILEVLVASAAHADLSGGKFCFDCSQKGHLPVRPGTLAHVDQLLDDMNSFRDDAHIAAWKPSGLDGHTMEVFTLVWNGAANTPEKLVEQLPYRSFQADDYQAALNKLVEKGWVSEGKDGYQVSDEGKKVRDQIEDATDANYFAPWNVLSKEDLQTLESTLTALIQANQSLLEDED